MRDNKHNTFPNRATSPRPISMLFSDLGHSFSRLIFFILANSETWDFKFSGAWPTKSCFNRIVIFYFEKLNL